MIETEDLIDPKIQTGHEVSSSKKFVAVLRFVTELAIQRPKTEGLENLQEIPLEQRVIFATSHLSDVDVSGAAEVLSPHRSVDIVILQTGAEDSKQIPFMSFAGWERFHPVDNTFSESTHTSHTRFNPNNFLEMKDAMCRGRDMTIAAHKGTRNWRMPDNPGIGNIYLSQLTRSPIIPVALDIHSEEPVGMAHDISGSWKRLLKGQRPTATLRIGESINLPQIPTDDLEDVARLLSNQRSDLRVDEGRYKKALYTLSQLRGQSKIVMRAIAIMLPEQKRGIWN